MKLNNIFIKYCFKHFIAFLLVLSCSFFVAFFAYFNFFNYVITTNQLRMQEGITYIDENISKMALMANITAQDSNYASIIQTHHVLPPKEALLLKYGKQLLSNLGFMYDFSPYIFSLFQKNNMYISSGQCSYNFDEYYNTFFRISSSEINSAADFKSLLFQNPNAISYWKADAVQYYQNDTLHTIADPIFCIINKSSYVMVFLIDPNTLLTRLTTDDTRNGGFVQIRNADTDTLLFTHYSDIENVSEKKHQLTYDVPMANWEVTVGIPDSVIRNQMQNIISLLLLYCFVGLLIVIIMTLHFSYRQFSNIQRVFKSLPGGRHPVKRDENEYDLICDILHDITENRENYEHQISSLSRQNQLIMLENLIVRGINSEKERQLFESCFQKPLEFFCVVLLKMRTKDQQCYNISLLCINEYLLESYEHEFLNVHSGAEDELFLFYLNPSAPSNVANIKTLFEGITSVLTEDMNIVFTVGISAVGTDISNLNVCYNQARQVTQAYGREHENSVRVYHININYSRENVVGIEFLEKLHNLLLCGEQDMICRQFTRLAAYYKKMPLQYETQKQQIFYSIRNIISSAYLHQSISTPEMSHLPDYTDCTITEMAEILKNAALEFCRVMEENKKSRNVELKERILNCISEGFTNPNLTASMVCHGIGISEKYLSQFLKEQTGDTFASYLERLRIQHAIHLLTTTNYNNEKIAQLTGFASVATFYRVFNKRIGVSPGNYRSNYTPPPEA